MCSPRPPNGRPRLARELVHCAGDDILHHPARDRARHHTAGSRHHRRPARTTLHAATSGEWAAKANRGGTRSHVSARLISCTVAYGVSTARPTSLPSRRSSSAALASSGARLMIEKVSGKIVRRHNVRRLSRTRGTSPRDPLGEAQLRQKARGYRTDITAEQVRGAPAFYGDGMVWPDRERENKARDYWRLPPS